MLREDLLATAMHLCGSDERSGRVLASLLSELGRDPELKDVAYRAVGRPPAPPIGS